MVVVFSLGEVMEEEEVQVHHRIRPYYNHLPCWSKMIEVDDETGSLRKCYVRIAHPLRCHRLLLLQPRSRPSYFNRSDDDDAQGEILLLG